MNDLSALYALASLRFRRPSDAPPVRRQSGPPPKRGRYVRKYQGIRRNDPCPCSSGRKFKACCINVTQFIEEEQKGDTCST